jgi:hypothetical protein
VLRTGDWGLETRDEEHSDCDSVSHSEFRCFGKVEGEGRMENEECRMESGERINDTNF